MTHITSAPQTASPAHEGRIRALRWGAPAAIVAAVLSIISVYGDGTLSGSQQASQEAALPWIIAVVVVLTGLLFGLGVPRLLRSRNLSGWGLALGIVGILALAAYWSGASVVFGTAAVLAGHRRPARGPDGGEDSEARRGRHHGGATRHRRRHHRDHRQHLSLTSPSLAH